jgi:hypothetical protein
MRKQSSIFTTVLLAASGLLLAACAGNTPTTSDGGATSEEPVSSVEEISIVDFSVDESKVDVADVGSEYTIKKVAAKLSDETYVNAVPTVKDPTNADVTITNNKFTCAKVGEYTVTYTVSVTNGPTASKSFKVNVTDVSEPEVSSSLHGDNITMVGATYDLSDITVSDNSGETITPTITVKFNGAAITPDNGVVAFSEKGTYVIEVAAKDSSENEVNATYNVYTTMDYEHGSYYNNEWYPTELSTAQAKTGTSSYKFGMFSKAPQWFNDFSMLGDVYLYGASQAKYVSFWIYFDSEAVGLHHVNAVQNARYNKQSVYDIYGETVKVDFQDKIECTNNNWYRFVMSLDEFEMAGLTGDHADADTHPSTDTLRNMCFYFNSWDSDAGGNSATAIDVYLDDVRLLGETDDEVYETKPQTPYVYPTNCVADFETASQIDNLGNVSWQSSLSYVTDTTYGSSKGAAAFTPSIEWSSFGFVNTSLPIDDLNGYNSLTMKIDITDSSDTNVYDDQTYITVDAKFDSEGATVASKAIKSVGEWVDFTIPLADYQANKVSNLLLVVYKKVNGATIGLGKTIEYGGSVKMIIDDVYVTKA